MVIIKLLSNTFVTLAPTTNILPVDVDGGWQFIADDCGVKCAVGAKLDHTYKSYL